MATYIVLCNFTEQGIRNVKDTTQRADAVRKMGKKFNVNMREIYWTLGEYDIVTVCETADEASATAFGLAIGSMGNVRTEMLRAFDEKEMNNILAKLTTSKVLEPA